MFSSGRWRCTAARIDFCRYSSEPRPGSMAAHRETHPRAGAGQCVYRVTERRGVTGGALREQ